MTTSSNPQPNATTFSVEDLVTSVREGRIRVPEFQRPLRWQWEDVRRLFESIVLGYPIGSILFWSRPALAASVELGALRIEARAMSDALWVVDGQQRITSLANALTDEGSADSRFALAYDLREKRFVRLGDAAHRVPLPVLFDLQRLLKWFAARPELTELLDEATRVTKAIRQYDAPTYIVKHEDDAALRDIFDRMNNYGRRLSRAEVFAALQAGRSSAGRSLSLTDISERLDVRFGFGLVDEDTLLRAFLARRGPDVTREIRSEFADKRVSREFPGETSAAAHEATELALERAIAFLQDEAGIPHFAFLPYRYLLVVLTRFFAHHPSPCPRNRDLLRRWLWRAALVGSALGRGGYTATMRALASCVVAGDEDASVQGLLALVGRYPQSFTFPTRFRSTMAEVRVVLCALWSLGPRSPLTGKPYERQALADTIGVRPTASEALETLFPGRSERRNDTANRVLLLGDDASGEARHSFSSRPVFLDEDAWSAILESHVVPVDASALLAENDGRALIEVRARELERITRAFLEQKTEMAFEDTPPLESLDLDEQDDDDRTGGLEPDHVPA